MRHAAMHAMHAVELDVDSPHEPSVSAENHVTLYWLECCVKAGTRIPFQLRPNDPKANRSTLLYRPFGFALPLKGFDLCR